MPSKVFGRLCLLDQPQCVLNRPVLFLQNFGEELTLHSDAQRVRNLLEEIVHFLLLGHGALDLEEVVPDVILQLHRQLSIFHGRVDIVDFILVPVGLNIHLVDEHGNLTSNPGHVDEAADVHENDEEEVHVLGRLHLVAADHEHRIVDADGPGVAPFASFSLEVLNDALVIQYV